MENVKKCKNFLSTLIKLASSGKQSTETAANVKELVQHLLVRASLGPWRVSDTWESQGAVRSRALPGQGFHPRLGVLVVCVVSCLGEGVPGSRWHCPVHLCLQL